MRRPGAVAVGTILLVLGVAAGALALMLGPDRASTLWSEDGRLSSFTVHWLGIYGKALTACAALLLVSGAIALARRHRLDAWLERSQAKLRRFGLVCVSGLLGLALAELALRALTAAGALPETQEFAFARHFRTYAHDYWQGISDQLDAGGFRDGRLEGTAGEDVIRILILGDSMVFGFGVKRMEDTFPAVVEARLAAKLGFGRVQVFNAGVPGADTASEVLLLADLLLQLSPDLVVLGHFSNDAETEEIKSRFFGGRRLVPLLSDQLILNSKLWALFEETLLSWMPKRWRSPSYAEHLASLYVETDSEWERHRKDLYRFVTTARKADVPVVAVLFPLLEGFEPYPLERAHVTLRGIFAKWDVPCLDLREVFAGEDARRLRVTPLDHHLNVEGLRRAGEAAAAFLLKSSPDVF